MIIVCKIFSTNFFPTHVGIHLDQFWILWNLDIQTSIPEYVIKLFYNENFHGDFSMSWVHDHIKDKRPLITTFYAIHDQKNVVYMYEKYQL
jgi:hypothetical protein